MESTVSPGTAYTFDPQGSAVQPVTLSLPGQPPFLKVRSSSAYDAFGSLRAAATADAADTFDPIGFGGQMGYYFDYTGLYLLTHRYYDAGAGRFVTRDPIGYKGGINLYGFAGNNPVNESDPSGFAPTLGQPIPDPLEKGMERVWERLAPGIARQLIRPAGTGLRMAGGTAAATAALFFMAQTRVADSSTGPGSPYYSQHRENRTFVIVSGAGSEVRRVRFRRSSNANWGLTATHINKHLFGSGPTSLTTLDPDGNGDIWGTHIADLLQSPATSTTSNGMIDIIKEFPKSGNVPGKYKLGVRLAPQSDGSYDLITILTKQ